MLLCHVTAYVVVLAFNPDTEGPWRLSQNLEDNVAAV